MRQTWIAAAALTAALLMAGCAGTPAASEGAGAKMKEFGLAQPAATSSAQSDAATFPRDSAANAAIAPMAQAVARQMGCGAVEASGEATFVAPCEGFNLLIDCNGSQCRPMHAIRTKADP